MTKGEYFKSLRKANKMKLIDIAEKSGLSIPSISRFENNITAPSITTVENLFDLLGFRLVPLPKDLIN